MAKYIIELSDGETQTVTEEQLIEMERVCDEFDGFYPWIVKEKIEE